MNLKVTGYKLILSNKKVSIKENVESRVSITFFIYKPTTFTNWPHVN